MNWNHRGDAFEEGAVAAALLSQNLLDGMARDGLKPEHFYRQDLGEVWASGLRLRDKDRPVDVNTIRADLATRGINMNGSLDALAGAAPAAGNAHYYGERVREEALWRGRHRTALLMQEAALDRDEGKFASAEAAVVQEDAAEEVVWNADRMREALYDSLGGTGEPLIGTPWVDLNAALGGGLRLGEMTVIAGHTGYGKSVVADQMAECATGVASVVINEMTPVERYKRFVSRQANVPFNRLRAEDLSVDASEKVVSFQLQGIEIVNAAERGWTAVDIVRYLRHRRPTIAVVDHFHLLPSQGGDEKDYSEMARVLAQGAKQANCHLLVVCQLNRGRYSASKTLARPTLADIRSTGMLAANADNVLFVHRENDEEGPGTEGEVYLAKCRSGEVGGKAKLHFNGNRMTFVERR